MARMGSRIHLCKSCEEQGLVTHVRPGQTLCARCLAEQQPPAPTPEEMGDRLDANTARKVLELRSEEARAIQAGLYATGGGLVGVAIVLRGTTPRYGPPLLSGSGMMIALLTGAVVGAVLGWFLGWNRPLWKSGL